MFNRYELFAQTVFHLECFLQPHFHCKILNYVENNFKREDCVSIKNGFQFHRDFPEKKNLVKIIETKCSEIKPYEIIHSWLNVLDSESYNIPHRHSGDNINASGVFYLSDLNNDLNLVHQNQVFSISPKLFDIFIFPYNLVHYVLPGKNKNKRICFAFNLRERKFNQ